MLPIRKPVFPMSTCFSNDDTGLVGLGISRSIRDVLASFCDPLKENEQRHHGTNMTDSKDVWNLLPIFFVSSVNGCAESKQRNEPIVSSGAEANTNNDRLICFAASRDGPICIFDHFCGSEQTQHTAPNLCFLQFSRLHSCLSRTPRPLSISKC